MKKILLTAFDAFGQDSLNASFELLKKIPTKINHFEIHKLQIPTVRYKSVEKILNQYHREHYDFVIALGQAGGSESIRLEKVGINLDDFRIEDNEGNQPIDEKIIESGETAHFSTLPLKKIVQHLKNYNIPVVISYTAGTFVCNHVLYSLLHYIKDAKVGFIHIPKISDEKTKGLPLNVMVEAIIKAIEVLDEKDIHTIGGVLD